VGDAKFQEKCLNRIDEIKNSGVTILFVSHSSQSVLKLCTRGMLLEEGRLLATGTAKEVTDRYLESLHLASGGETLAPGASESRVGLYAGRVAGMLLGQLREGCIVFNIPVETGDGICIVDVGWVSKSRLKTMRTEPAWSAAPDICVSIISAAKPALRAEHDMHHFVHSGATEAWIVYGDGAISRFKPQHGKFLIPEHLTAVPAI